MGSASHLFLPRPARRRGAHSPDRGRVPGPAARWRERQRPLGDGRGPQAGPRLRLPRPAPRRPGSRRRRGARAARVQPRAREGVNLQRDARAAHGGHGRGRPHARGAGPDHAAGGPRGRGPHRARARLRPGAGRWLGRRGAVRLGLPQRPGQRGGGGARGPGLPGEHGRGGGPRGVGSGHPIRDSGGGHGRGRGLPQRGRRRAGGGGRLEPTLGLLGLDHAGALRALRHRPRQHGRRLGDARLLLEPPPAERPARAALGRRQHHHPGARSLALCCMGTRTRTHARTHARTQARTHARTLSSFLSLSCPRARRLEADASFFRSS